MLKAKQFFLAYDFARFINSWSNRKVNFVCMIGLFLIVNKGEIKIRSGLLGFLDCFFMVIPALKIGQQDIEFMSSCLWVIPSNWRIYQGEWIKMLVEPVRLLSHPFTSRKSPHHIFEYLDL